MNENWIRDHGDKPKADLLVGEEEIEVDRVQTALSSCTGREEEGIDVSHVPPYERDSRADQDAGDNVRIVDGHKVELFSKLDGVQPLQGRFEPRKPS